MMGNSTAIVLMERQGLFAPRFGRGMSPEKHGEDFFNKLSQVQNEDDFTFFITKFDDENYQSKDDNVHRTDNEKLYTNYDTEDIFQINLDGNYYSDFYCDNICFSEYVWLFIKNLSGKTVRFICLTDDVYTKKVVILKHGETVRFNFGGVNKYHTSQIRAIEMEDEDTLEEEDYDYDYGYNNYEDSVDYEEDEEEEAEEEDVYEAW